MKQEEQLQRIRARCVELLEIANKRTQGKWEHHGERVAIWWGDECHSGDWIDGRMTEHDAAYIAACTGPAEAGWRATIAAIDLILSEPSLPDVYSEPVLEGYMNDLADAIIAAWKGKL